MQHSCPPGRRVHISGTVAVRPDIAKVATIEDADSMVVALVQRGTNFITSFVVEQPRPDGLLICFSALTETHNTGFRSCTQDASGRMAIAVKQGKPRRESLADTLPRGAYGLALCIPPVANAEQSIVNARRMQKRVASAAGTIVAWADTFGVDD